MMWWTMGTHELDDGRTPCRIRGRNYHGVLNEGKLILL
jgi:hypothetical protein